MDLKHFDKTTIPIEIRQKADELAREWEEGARGRSRRTWAATDLACAIEYDARNLMERVSTLLTGDAEALGETRDELGINITYNEALNVLVNYPDSDVPRWLAAAEAYAKEAQS